MKTSAANEFAQWLGDTHPEVYEALFAQAMRAHAGLSGLGDVQDEFGISDFTPDTLDAVNVDTGNLDYVEASAYGDAVDALPGGLENLTGGTSSSSPVSSTQGVTGAVSSIGNWLTSPSGLTAIANLGTAVLNTVATTQVAKTQMAVIQAQAQRASQNQSPLPVTYIQGANGQQVPVYVVGAGQQVPASIVSAIGNGTAQQVQLSNGSVGYTLNSSSLSSLLGGNNLLIVGLIAGGLLLLLAAGRST
jgi:hypothetical protein